MSVSALRASSRDCSGLLNALLGRTDPQALAALIAASPNGRPQAIDYVAAIGRGDAFLRITRVDAIVPGDIVAIAYPPGASDTGHVVLVDALPEPPKNACSARVLSARRGKQDAC